MPTQLEPSVLCPLCSSSPFACRFSTLSSRAIVSSRRVSSYRPHPTTFWTPSINFLASWLRSGNGLNYCWNYFIHCSFLAGLSMKIIFMAPAKSFQCTFSAQFHVLFVTHCICYFSIEKKKMRNSPLKRPGENLVWLPRYSLKRGVTEWGYFSSLAFCHVIFMDWFSWLECPLRRNY